MVELEVMADVVELGETLLDPTGGFVLPSNWVSKAPERIAIATMRTTKVSLFPAGFVTAYFLSRLGESSLIVAAGGEGLDQK